MKMYEGANQMITFQNLPNEIFMNIIDLLSILDRYRLRLISKRFKFLCDCSLSLISNLLIIQQKNYSVHPCRATEYYSLDHENVCKIFESDSRVINFFLSNCGQFLQSLSLMQIELPIIKNNNRVNFLNISYLIADNCCNLTSLKFYSCPISDQEYLEVIFRKIGFQLTELVCFWGDFAFEHIFEPMVKYLDSSRFISFGCSVLGDEQLQLVYLHFPNLISLEIDDNVEILPSLLRKFSRLQNLKSSPDQSLPGLNWVSLESWKHSLHTLHIMEILNCPVEEFMYLKELTALKNLSFIVERKDYFSFISFVCQNLSKLESLEISIDDYGKCHQPPEFYKLECLKTLKIQFFCSNVGFFRFHEMPPIKSLESLAFIAIKEFVTTSTYKDTCDISLIIKNLPTIAPNLIKLRTRGWIWPRILGQCLSQLKRIQILELFALERQRRFLKSKMKNICKTRSIDFSFDFLYDNNHHAKMFQYSFFESVHEK